MIEIPKYYEVPDTYKNYVDVIESLGARHYKVTLKGGWCFKDNGVHKEIVERYRLFSTFKDIVTCSCTDCFLKGYYKDKKILL